MTRAITYTVKADPAPPNPAAPFIVETSDRASWHVESETVGQITGDAYAVKHTAVTHGVTTAADAKAYIISHDDRVRLLDRTAKTELRRILVRRRAEAGIGRSIIGGPDYMSKDELINEIVDREFPQVQAARDIYYAAILPGDGLAATP